MFNFAVKSNNPLCEKSLIKNLRQYFTSHLFSLIFRAESKQTPCISKENRRGVTEKLKHAEATWSNVQCIHMVGLRTRQCLHIAQCLNVKQRQHVRMYAFRNTRCMRAFFPNVLRNIGTLSGTISPPSATPQEVPCKQKKAKNTDLQRPTIYSSPSESRLQPVDVLAWLISFEECERWDGGFTIRRELWSSLCFSIF